MFDDFKFLDLLLLTCDIMAVRLLFLYLVKTFLPYFLLGELYIISNIFPYYNQLLKFIKMKLNIHITFNDIGTNSSHKTIFG